MLLPETDLAGAEATAERVRAEVEGTVIDTELGPLTVTASFGVAQLTAAEPDMGTVLGMADAALYEAKAAGRNRVVVAAVPLS